MALEIIVILLLVLANGVFAIAEFAVISARKPRLQEQAEEGRKSARMALALAEDPSRFLSMVQIGITLVGTLAGAFGGATVATQLALLVERVSFLAPYSEAISVTAVVLVITYLSLILGELVPKRLAMGNPERIAGLVAPPMTALAKLTSPAVQLLSASTDLVLHILGIQPSDQPSVTEEEVKIMLEHGTRVGVFEPIEEEMVERVFRLSDRSVSALITPRPEIIWLDIDDPPQEVERKIMNSTHSNFPVARGDLDNIMGLVHTKDLLAASLEGEPLDLHKLLTEPLFVPEGMPAFAMLERFKETRSTIALVVDEYGSLEGLVTLNDMLEAIVGDLPEPDEPDESEIVQREDGSWLVDGRVPLDELENLLNMRDLPGDSETYQTLGGMVMTTLGRIPTTSDHFTWQGTRFEVMDMDGRRVDKVLVTLPPESEETPPEQDTD